LAELDRREKQEDTKGEESDALIAVYDLNRAVAILIQVDNRFKDVIPDSKLFTPPPPFFIWIKHFIERVKTWV
jgi:hypothetical protein